MIVFLSVIWRRNVTVSFPAMIVKIVLFDTMRTGQYVFTTRIKYMLSLLQEIARLLS